MPLTEAPVVEAPPTAQSAVGVDRVCPEECECLKCKLRYWRQNGIQTRIPAEWGTGPTNNEIRAETYAAAKRDGRDIRLASRAELI